MTAKRRDGVVTGSQLDHWYREMARHRHLAAAHAAEAEFLRWLTSGCRLDRSGILGVSLLDSPKAIGAALDAEARL